MNREHIKNALHVATKLVPFHVLRRLTNQNFIFPFYHVVADKTPAYIKHLYPAPTPGQFTSDLEFLLKNYYPATIDDVTQFIKNGKTSKKPMFFISFDDGLKECFQVVYPVLKEKGIQAAFFINPDFVDNQSFFYRFKTSLITDEVLQVHDEKTLVKIAGILNLPFSEKQKLIQTIGGLKETETSKLDEIAVILGINLNEMLQNAQPYMTLDELKQLDSEGFIIGSHSMDHPLFSELAEQQQIEQFEKSMEFIRNNFHPPAYTFAFPYTDDGISSSFFDHVENSGKAEITFGTAGLKKDSRFSHIQRIPMETGKENTEQVLRSEYAYFLFKSFFGKNTIIR